MSLDLLVAQVRPHKGDYAANLTQVAGIFAQLDHLSPRPAVLVLPETALSGYFLEGGVREVARTAGAVAADLQAHYVAACGSDAPALDIVIGFYELYRDRMHNSALYATLNGPLPDGSTSVIVRHVHRKVFLPTYGVFDEGRFVEPGHQVVAFDTNYGRVAMLVCEDAWHNVTGLIAALDGAQIVYVVSASPARGTRGPRPGNVEHWEDLIRRIADEQGVFVVLSQLVGFEGGKGFAGGSMVMGPRGDLRATAPLWDDALLPVTLDLDELVLARADAPLLADLETMLPHMQREIERAARHIPARVEWDSPRPTRTSLAPTPQRNTTSSGQTYPTLPIMTSPAFDPHATDILAMDAALVEQWLIGFLRDEVIRRRGFKQVVLALSGGVDSTLVAYLCAKAFGAAQVLALRMPYRTSSRDSLDHAQLAIADLGIRSTTIDISPAVDGYANHDPEMDAHRKGNIMSRTRMIALFDYSQKLRALPIGTGNKTERLFGYFTWHGDDSPPVNPIGDLFKTQVWQLARYVGVPDVIVDKPASADLIVGQTDEDDLGISYPEADRILAYLLQGYPPEQLIARGFAADKVRLVKRRVDSTHWKRHLPSTAMLTDTAINEYYLRPLDF